MNAPKLAIGDGAMGFWAAMDEVYPETRHQRCWQHKTMNVLNCLPKLSQPKAKSQGRAARHLAGRDQSRCRKGIRSVHQNLKTQIPQGHTMPAKRS
jgi:transposase-like protein